MGNPFAGEHFRRKQGRIVRLGPTRNRAEKDAVEAIKGQKDSKGAMTG